MAQRATPAAEGVPMRAPIAYLQDEASGIYAISFDGDWVTVDVDQFRDFQGFRRKGKDQP